MNTNNKKMALPLMVQSSLFWYSWYIVFINALALPTNIQKLSFYSYGNRFCWLLCVYLCKKSLFAIFMLKNSKHSFYFLYYVFFMCDMKEHKKWEAIQQWERTMILFPGLVFHHEWNCIVEYTLPRFKFFTFYFITRCIIYSYIFFLTYFSVCSMLVVISLLQPKTEKLWLFFSDHNVH